MRKNKIVSILLSLVISVCLWIYVVSTVTPDDSQWITNIPVTFVNEDGLFSDRNLVLSEGRDTTVDLKLYGKRQDLLKLNSTNITITADLSQVTGSGPWRLPYEIEFPETVSSSEIKVENRSSYYINIDVDKLATKEVEVRALFKGDVAEGYTQEAIELEYDSIQVSGPRELVDSVAWAQVLLERTNVSKSVSDTLTFTLLDGEGNVVESDELKCTVNNTTVDKIGVFMPVYMVKEVPLRVDFIEGGGATVDHAVWDISPSTVTIKGDPEVLSGLNSITLGTVDLSSIQTTYKKEFEVVIADGLTNMTDTTATVSVELKNLKTKTFRVTNISVTNKPEGLQAQVGTLSLQVQLRGPAETVDALTASNVRAVADLSGLNGTGQFTVNTDIYVDGVSDVGAMGSYSVLVTLSEASTETAVEVTSSPVTSAAAETAAATEEDTGS